VPGLRGGLKCPTHAIAEGVLGEVLLLLPLLDVVLLDQVAFVLDQQAGDGEPLLLVVLVFL
jgi:hypothetical protein